MFNIQLQRDEAIERRKITVDEGLRGTPDRRHLGPQTKKPLKPLLCQRERRVKQSGSESYFFYQPRTGSRIRFITQGNTPAHYRASNAVRACHGADVHTNTEVDGSPGPLRFVTHRGEFKLTADCYADFGDPH
jgi:hypothetical protein